MTLRLRGFAAILSLLLMAAQLRELIDEVL
jgi:hypothetical protein